VKKGLSIAYDFEKMEKIVLLGVWENSKETNKKLSTFIKENDNLKK